MHTEINSVRLSEEMGRRDKGGKPVLIGEHGWKTLWYARGTQTKTYYEIEHLSERCQESRFKIY